MINNKIHRPKIMGDAFSKNMTSYSVILNEINKDKNLGFDDTDAVKHASKKYGRKAVEEALDQ